MLKKSYSIDELASRSRDNLKVSTLTAAVAGISRTDPALALLTMCGCVFLGLGK